MDTFAIANDRKKYPWILLPVQNNIWILFSTHKNIHGYFCYTRSNDSGFFFKIFCDFLSSETTCLESASTHWWNTPLSGECVWASKVHGGPSLRVYWRKSKLIFPEIPVRLAGSSWTKTAHSTQVILFPTHLAM